MRRSSAATAVAIAVAVLVTAGVGVWPAWAHGFLVRTDPAQGARLDRPPEEVALQFSEPVDPSSVVVEVGSATGDQAAAGEPRLSSGGRLLRVTGLALAAGALVALRFLPTPAQQQGLVAALASGGLVVAAAGAAWPLLSAGAAAAATGGGPSPAAGVIVAGLSLLLLLLVVAVPLARLPGTHVAALGMVGLAAALSSARGHAAAYAGWVGGLVDFVHLAAAAVWVGSLVAVAAVLWPLRRSDPASARRLVAGYARLAVRLVVIVAVSGAYSATRLLTQPADLVAIGYGRLLLAKLTLVAAAVGLALAGRLRGLPGQRVRLLRRVTASEAAVLVAVLAVTAVLTGVGPPAGQADAASLLGPPPLQGPVARSAGLAGALTVYATAGDGQLQVEIAGPSGGIAGARAQVVADLPDGRKVDLQPRPCGDGCLVQQLDLPEGATELTVHAGAPGWAGGWFSGTLPWPPEPENPQLLVDLVERMRHVADLELVERVSSGPQSGGGESRARLSGDRFLDLVPYGAGDADEVRPLPGEPEAFAFSLTGSRIHVTVWLDEQGRMDRQRIVSPGHEINHRLDYPSDDGGPR